MQGLFFDYQDLMEKVGTGYAAAINLEVCRNVELLLLDDLGSHRPKDAIEDAIMSVVKHRCNYQKPLIATTNLSDADASSPLIKKSAIGRIEYGITLAERIGAHVRSRLFEMCTVVRMPLVEDYRLRRGATP